MSSPLHRQRHFWLCLISGCILTCLTIIWFQLAPATSSLQIPTHNRTEGFTIVTPTYHRTDRLVRFLGTYASGAIPSLDRIVLQWVDSTKPPTQELLDKLESMPVPVVLDMMPDRSLNHRFSTTHVRTDCILSVDDDVHFRAADIELGYQVWKIWGRQRMVGYHAREREPGKYLVHRAPTYSMVLTKTAFFHRDWAEAYWSDDPAVIEGRKFVDENRNGEDILMAYLVANKTRLPPVYVEAKFHDIGGGGISAASDHIPGRSACVDKFDALFGPDTLLSTTVQVTGY